MSTWIFEPGHTEAEFRARHMMVTWVRGLFKDIHGRLEVDWSRPLETRFEGKVDVTGIWTGQPERDAHLRSADFFDVENHPEIRFRSTLVERDGDDYVVAGELTIRGITQPVKLAVERLGSGRDPWGGERVGFAAKTTINRKDFGLHWNQAPETGGVLVGEKVEINLDIEAVRVAQQKVA